MPIDFQTYQRAQEIHCKWAGTIFTAFPKKRLFGFYTNSGNSRFILFILEFNINNSRNEIDQLFETISLTTPTATVAPESLTANLPS